MREFILPFIGFVLLMGVTIWRSFARERLRTRRLTNLAPTLGFSMMNQSRFYPIDTSLFHLGDNGRNLVKNAMEGTVAGLQAAVFDFYFETDRGEDSTRSWHTVAVFAFPGRDRPHFSIARAGLLSRRASHRIEIEGNPEFSQHFVVTGKDRPAVQKLLNPRRMQTVVSARRSEKLIIEGAGPGPQCDLPLAVFRPHFRNPG